MHDDVGQMYRDLTAQYGRLVAVEPTFGNRVRLQFENGAVERPPLLTYGYSGTGVDNLRAFLMEAGFDEDGIADVDTPEWEGVSIP